MVRIISSRPMYRIIGNAIELVHAERATTAPVSLAALFPPVCKPLEHPGPSISDAMRSACQMRRPAQSAAAQS